MSCSRVGQQVKNGASFSEDENFFYLRPKVYAYLSCGYKIRRCWIFDDRAGSDPGSSLRATGCKVGYPLLRPWLDPNRRHYRWDTLFWRGKYRRSN